MIHKWWIWNQKHWSYHCFISEFSGSRRQIKGRWNILNAYEIIQYIFHQKRVSYIFNLLSMDIFSCAAIVFSEFLIIFTFRAFCSQSSLFLIYRKFSVCHLLKIPRTGHLNESSLINSIFQIDLQPFHYCTKSWPNRNTRDLIWHHQPLKDELEID